MTLFEPQSERFHMRKIFQWVAVEHQKARLVAFFEPSDFSLREDRARA
jgi:hypothetical protein